MFCSTTCIAKFVNERKGNCLNFEEQILLKSLPFCGGSIEKLKDLEENKTIFDFDLSDPEDPSYNYNMLTAVNSMMMEMKYASSTLPQVMFHYPTLKLFNDKKGKEIAHAFMLKIYRILSLNLYGIDWAIPTSNHLSLRQFVEIKRLGDAIFVFGSLINHSCVGNIERVNVDSKVAYIVKVPIGKGEQLFINYG